MSEKIRQRYNQYVKDSSPDDFLGQVRRTLDGKPVPAEQIELIISAILSGLELDANDAVLDLCCGNGFLSDRIFKQCRGGIGVDLSDGLIEVAQRAFQHLPERRYVRSDVVAYVQDTNDTGDFTKAMCYGSFPHLNDSAALTVLTGLRQRFPAVRRVFVGNLPDKAHLMDFYYESAYVPGIENDPESALGIWRTQAEFAALAEKAGWSVEARKMPSDFYASHYRYDAILTPQL